MYNADCVICQPPVIRQFVLGIVSLCAQRVQMRRDRTLPAVQRGRRTRMTRQALGVLGMQLAVDAEYLGSTAAHVLLAVRASANQERLQVGVVELREPAD